MNDHIYFSDDGSLRTWLGPKPPDKINYARIWTQEHPQTDNGEIMYGMFTLMNGSLNQQTGQFSPGYGLPQAASPFESGNSLLYRTWQWGRSAPILAFLAPAIFALLSILTLGTRTSSFFAYATGYMMFYCILLFPLLVAWGIYSALHGHKEAKKNAEKQIRDEILSDPALALTVGNYFCPICNMNHLSYDTTTHAATCMGGDGSWEIAL